MILKVRKDFMAFKQRDFITKWSTVVDFHTLETRPLCLCLCFVNSGFPRKTNFASK